MPVSNLESGMGSELAPRFHAYGWRDLERLPQLERFDSQRRLAMRAVAQVFPFRVNDFVINELIDWDAVPDDPIFQLTFPQPGMLDDDDLATMAHLVEQDAPNDVRQAAAHEIRRGLNPHPAGQVDFNVPQDRAGRPLTGMQHKYRETVLFFPAAGQTCHAYCNYCFRWPQFVDQPGLKFAERDAHRLVEYLRDHREVSSVLFTGGDPMVMSGKVLRSYIDPLLVPDLSHVRTIRIGTKSMSYWPHRYTTDQDADDIMRLYERVVESGRMLTMMAHFCHPNELELIQVQRAIQRVRSTGAEIYAQSPVVRHVNDEAETWAELLERGVQLGVNPYYMFVERDTGAHHYFELPLARAHEIYTSALRSVTGLARTVRGPTMSCFPGKVLIDDILEVAGEKVFALKFLQGRDPDWVGRIFFARFDPNTTWFDGLVPAGGEARFFFAPRLDAMIREGRMRPWLA